MERGALTSGENFTLQKLSVSDAVPRTLTMLVIEGEELTEIFGEYDFFGEQQYSYRLMPREQGDEDGRFYEDMTLFFTGIEKPEDAVALLAAIQSSDQDQSEQQLTALQNRYHDSPCRPEVEAFVATIRELKQRDLRRAAVVATHEGLILPPIDRLLEVAHSLNDYFIAKRQEVLRDPEWITKQLDPAVQAYITAAEKLHFMNPDVLIADETTVRAKFKTWFTPEKFTAINQVMEQNPDLVFHLVVTLNIAVNLDHNCGPDG